MIIYTHIPSNTKWTLLGEYYTSIDNEQIPRFIVESGGKDWRKYKDYVITSFHCYNEYYKRENNGLFTNKNYTNALPEHECKNQNFKINSIKFIENNLEIKIGDPIKAKKIDTIEFIIDGFSEEEDGENRGLFIHCKSKNGRQTYIDVLSEFILNPVVTKEEPQVLFTTEDGKEIYDGKDVEITYAVDKKFYITVAKRKKIKQGKKYFYAIGNAQAYIIENKPLFSLNDESENKINWKEAEKRCNFKK